MHESNIRIIEKLKSFLKKASTNKLRYCTKPTDFTRNRKLTFERVVGMLINIPRKGLSLELNELFDRLNLGACYCTKSAFSQARYKLKHCFFKDWNQHLALQFYKEESRVKRWKDFILLGVDGSTAHLFEDVDGNIAGHFGKYRGAVTARVMCSFDVLNQISYQSSIDPITMSENEVARNWLTQIETDQAILKKVLPIYDMKFPGFAFAYEHMIKGIDFLIRIPLGFNCLVYDFMKSDKKDSVLKWYPPRNAVRELKARGYEISKSDFIKVRLLKIPLDDGSIEVLLTTLLDKRKYPYKEFGPLYFKRWGSETNFDYWKNKAQIEIISGHSVEAIYQDFYATVFTANLHSILMEECEEELILKTQDRKYDYALNRNVGLGLLKGKIIKLFFDDNPKPILEELHRLFLFHLEPVRPDRQFERKRRQRHLGGKYATMTNYRRAI